MRLHTPVPFIMRQLSHDMEVDGHVIPTGTRVTIHLYNLHHNPHIWSNPDQYIPERFSKERSDEIDSFAFIPFSAGSRYVVFG